MRVIIRKGTGRQADNEEGANITKSLSSFNVLQKKSRNRRVTFLKGRAIYAAKDGDPEVKIGDAPKK